MLGSFAIENDLKQRIKTPTRVTQNSKTLIGLIYALALVIGLFKAE